MPRLMREQFLHPRTCDQNQDGKHDGEPDGAPCREAAGDAECGSDPDRGRGGQPLHALCLGVAQDHPGADEADSGHHPLDDALDHAAERIRIGRYSLDVRSRQRNDRCAERHQRERPHSDRLVGQVAVDADGRSGQDGRAEAQDDVDRFIH
jgi:hypothetical protein